MSLVNGCTENFLLVSCSEFLEHVIILGNFTKMKEATGENWNPWYGPEALVIEDGLLLRYDSGAV